MAGVDARGPGRGAGGTNLILVLLVLVVLGLVVWLVINRGGGSEVEIDVPQVETPDVDVKGAR